MQSSRRWQTPRMATRYTPILPDLRTVCRSVRCSCSVFLEQTSNRHVSSGHWDSSTLPTLHAWLAAPRTSCPSSSPDSRSVRLIVFKFGKEPIIHGAFKTTEWNSVDKCIAGLPALSAVCFMFSCLEHAEYFHKDVLSHKMPILRGSRLFRYMLDDENNRRLSVLGRGETLHVIGTFF